MVSLATGISRIAPLATAPMYAIPTSSVVEPFAPTTPSWSQTHGTTADDFAGAITTDGSGDLLIAGLLAGAIDFGCGAMTPKGALDTFVVKLAPNGSCLWSTHFGGSADGWPTSLITDASGNIYVSGTYAGSLTFGASTITSKGGHDAYVAALTINGAAKWAVTLGGAGDDDGYGVAVSGSNVVAVGDFTNSMTAGGVTLTNNGAGGGFAVALGVADGALGWAHTVGTGCALSAYSIVPTASGVAVAGAFRQSSDFGGGSVTSAGGVDGFVVGYDSTGAYRWSTIFGGSADDLVGALAAAPDGGILATGYFMGSASFRASTVPSMTGAGHFTGFAAKLGATGAVSWNRAIDATGLVTANGIAADANGDVLVTGWFEGTATLPGGSFAAKGTDDVFLAHYSATGADIGAATYGGSGSAGGFGVVSPSTGVAAVTGYFNSSINLGSGSVATVGGYDMFLLSSATP